MRQINSLLAIAMVLFASSCKKTENVTPENNDTPTTLSQEFADLQNSLYELNQEMIPSSTETRSSFKRWLIVGLADATGAACGWACGGAGGAIILGTAASTYYFKVTEPFESRFSGLNRFKDEEQAFLLAIGALQDASGAQVGVLHNQMIRSAYDEKGTELFELAPQELVPVFEEALPDEYKDELFVNNESLSESVQDFIYSPETGETTTAFVMGLCEKYPEAAQELTVLLPILEGIDASRSDKAALKYALRAMTTIKNSAIPAESKNILFCGTSVAFESKLLWNLSATK